jgi:hypothetical protein
MNWYYHKMILSFLILLVQRVNGTLDIIPKAKVASHLSFNNKLDIHISNRGKNRSPIYSTILDLRAGSYRDYENDDPYQGHNDHISSSSKTYSSSRSGEGYYDDKYDSERYKDDDRYYEEDRYDNDRAPRRRSSSKQNLNMPDVGGLIRNGNKKIGMALLGGGAVFTLLGISLFFNKALIRLGNLLFIAGVPLFIGPGRTTGYFLQPQKARATGCLVAGIFLVMIGWPILGIALEVFGVLNLFGNMFPVLMILLKQMPIVGSLLKRSGDNSSSRSKSKRNSYRDDNYRYDDYEDDGYRNDGDYRDRY